MEHGIDIAIRLFGNQSALADFLGLTPQAIQKWASNKCLPRTEWTGETNYASLISNRFPEQVTREQLLTRPETIQV